MELSMTPTCGPASPTPLFITSPGPGPNALLPGAKNRRYVQEQRGGCFSKPAICPTNPWLRHRNVFRQRTAGCAEVSEDYW
jgi:hypothetical protein